MYKILSIDGGGIRGIIPAMILAEIENRAGKPVSEIFDLIAGTSTGGVLALALTRPDEDGKPCYTAGDLVKLYEEKGKEIFSRSLWRRFKFWDCLWGARYPACGIEKVLAEMFGTYRLSDALTDIIITSYDVESCNPWFFKRSHAKDPAREGEDFFMKDVARSTAAAPIYFPPVKVYAGSPLNYRCLIDGGLYANNPAMCALVAAIKNKVDLSDILVVSIGTGQLNNFLPYKKVKKWGYIRWALPIIDVVLDGQSDTVDYQLCQLLYKESEDNQYYRFQVALDRRNSAIDDATKENLHALKVLAQNLIDEKNDVLETLCRKLAGGVREPEERRPFHDEAAAARE